MLSALILVCSLTTVPNMDSCTEKTAIAVISDPDTFASPITCFVHGQAYLAETSISDALEPDDIVRVICSRRRIAG